MSDRVHLLGCGFDPFTFEETVSVIARMVESGERGQLVGVNADRVVMMRDDPEMRRMVESCEIVNPDGQSVVWASRFLGRPLPERVAGVDLLQRLVALAAERGWRVYLLGAKPEVVRGAADAFVRAHPDLVLAGVHDGYFGEAESAAVAAEIADSRADLLFVGMPSPAKEIWLDRHFADTNVRFAMGVGGSFDVIAGVAKRAPVWMQRTGLEWFYRLIQEPGRLWRRYLVGNSRFIGMVIRERFSRG